MTVNVEDLREHVAEANRRLAEAGVVSLSFGNASGVDRDRGVMAIKASGVACERVQAQDTVVVSLDDGAVVEGTLRPSSDTPTHLVLYRRFDRVGGVVHTHSPFATAWAQAGREIPPFGTTHADHWSGPVPVTPPLTAEEIAGDYEAETGQVIARIFDELGRDPLHLPGILVASHGPFTWGADAAEAATNAMALEILA
ncbi:MAG TPA: class II aldolase/adducin family protein, partial [Actinomycetota bacterium]